MNKTSIEWCDFTANPIRYRDASRKSVWACVKASEGCQHCYAEALAHRYQGREFTAKAMEGVTPYVDDRELKAMLSPTKLPAGSRVFVGDMTDMFGPWVPFELLDRVFAVFALRPDVVFQVLTKRPERMREYLANDECRMSNVAEQIYPVMDGLPRKAQEEAIMRKLFSGSPWPLPNVWLGTSAENQHWADVRIPELLATPAAVRFVSCEPLLGEVDLRFQGIIAAGRPLTAAQADELRRELQRQWDDIHSGGKVAHLPDRTAYEPLLDWVIVGGESGPGARPCDVGWIRSIVAQCKAAGVAAFVKQLGARPYNSWACADDHGEHGKCDQRTHLKSRKGADPDEWPEDLRVREWPL